MPTIDPTTPAGTMPNGKTGGYTLIMSDEFNSTTLDSKWKNEHDFADHTASTAWDINAGGNSALRMWWNGNTATDNQMFTTTGANPFRSRFGYYEARIKAPRGRGLFPGFWLYPYSNSQQENADGLQQEIDITEWFHDEVNNDNFVDLTNFRSKNSKFTIWQDGGGGNTNQTACRYLAHSNNDNSGDAGRSGGVFPGYVTTLSTQFHTYGMEWLSTGQMRYFFDGVEVGLDCVDPWGSANNMQLVTIMQLWWGPNGGTGTPDAAHTPTGPPGSTAALDDIVMSWDYVRVWSIGGTPAPAPAPAPAPVRDFLKQPFDQYSIWNTPIGTGAAYADASSNGTDHLGNPNTHGPSSSQGGGWASMPNSEVNHIVMSAASPLRTIAYSSIAWSGGNRCPATGGNVNGLPFNAPIPDSYIVPNNNGNDCAAFLMADGLSVKQCEPFARCTAAGNGTAYITSTNWNIANIKTDRGELGAQGGSGLSGFGGAIRIHELRPGQSGPYHALKLVVYAKQFLYSGTPKFKWPAVNADGYANGWYGTNANGTATDVGGGTGGSGTNNNANMVMGALLAIPLSASAASLGLVTEPAKQLLWTLQNFGAYIVDDTYANGFGIAIEDGPNGSVVANFLTDYGITFSLLARDLTLNATAANRNWVGDVQKLANALQVITNNTQANNIANRPAGGGSPLVPFVDSVPTPSPAPPMTAVLTSTTFADGATINGLASFRVDGDSIQNCELLGGSAGTYTPFYGRFTLGPGLGGSASRACTFNWDTTTLSNGPLVVHVSAYSTPPNVAGATEIVAGERHYIINNVAPSPISISATASAGPLTLDMQFISSELDMLSRYVKTGKK